MNVSMGDSFNLGWKLISVLTGRSSPELLHSYSDERRAAAKGLVDYDHEWARVVSAPPADNVPEGERVSPIQERFVAGGRFTAGLTIKYEPSTLTSDGVWQKLAKGFEIGTRFHSAPVIRLADAKPMHLGHTVKADTRWHIYCFSGAEDPTEPASAVHELCKFLENDIKSPLRVHTPDGADIDSVIEVHGVFQQGFRELAFEKMPELMRPAKGRYGLTDYEKMFCADLKSGEDIFDMRGVERKKGCVVIVRPDQYVAHILPLNAYAEMADFFAGFLLPAR